MRHDDSFPVKACFYAAADIPLYAPVFADRAGHSDLYHNGIALKGDDAHDLGCFFDPFNLFTGDLHFLPDQADHPFMVFFIGTGNIDHRALESPGQIGDRPDIAVGNYDQIPVPIPE